MSEEKNMPTHKAKNGAFTATVFENSGEKDGKEFSYKSVVLRRSYTKDEGKSWEEEKINLRLNDFAKVKSVLDSVYQQVAVSEGVPEATE